MQVVLTVTQENINENGVNFDNKGKCPIAVALQKVLDEDVQIEVFHNYIQLTYGEEEIEIPFSETVPEIYKSNLGNLDVETEMEPNEMTEEELKNFVSPLVPFTSIFEIPIDYLKDSYQGQTVILA